jgi:PAS domain S-box-containing protein
VKDSPSHSGSDDTSDSNKRAESHRDVPTIPDLVFHGISSSHAVAFVSPSCERVLGYEPEQAIGLRATDVVHPDDLPRVAQALDSAAGNGEVVSVEFRIVDAHGDQRWVEGTVYQPPDGAGGAGDIQMLGVSRDITARRMGAGIAAIGRRLNTALAECASVDRLLQVIPAELRVLDGTTCCGIQLQLDLQANQVISCAQSGGTSCPRFLRRVGAGSRVAESIDRGEPIIVDLHSEGLPRGEHMAPEARAFVAVPIMHGTNVLGSLLLANRYHPRYFEGQLDLLMSLGGRIGADIMRVRESGKREARRQSGIAWSRWELKDGMLVLIVCNEQADALSVSALSRFVGRAVDEVLPHCPQLLRKMYDCVHTGKGEEYQDWYDFRHSDREPARLRVNITRSGCGQIEVTGEDVTQEPVAEVDSCDRECLARCLEEMCSGHSMLLDSDGRILIMDQAMAFICGTTADKVSGEDVARIVPADLWQLLRGPIATCWRQSTSVSFSCRWKGRCFEWRLTPVDSGRSRGARMALVARDVSSQVSAVEAIESCEQRYRLLAENAREMISLHNCDGVFEFASFASLAILGLSPEALLGRNPYDLIHPEDRLRVSDAQDAVLTSAGKRRIEFRMKHFRGDYVWVESTACCVRDDGSAESPWIVCVTRDISRRKQAEEDLKAAMRQLESKQIALSEVLCRFAAEKESVSMAVGERIRSALLPVLMDLKRHVPEALQDRLGALATMIEQVTKSPPEPADDRLAGLTQREVEVCRLIRDGLSTKEIAGALGLSPLTVNKHRETIRRKLGVQNKGVNLRSFLKQARL